MGVVLGTTSSTRRAAVAGLFYPAPGRELRATVRGLLDGASPSGPPPKAVIAPHAGYPYSGPVAASAFRCAAARRAAIRRVVLVGPSHFVRFAGVASSGALAFETPLGTVEVDTIAQDALSALPFVTALPEAHAREHCLEVELPFLQEILGPFRIVPLVVGDATTEEVGRALELAWGGDETLVVVSSDLSHYHDYDTARTIDAATARAIEELRFADIEPEHACGSLAIRGLLWVARRKGLRAATLDLRSSGDTAGPRHEVVGYGAWTLA
ncbi:MAG TPA: AmmeMemoRadiSam system protein B [Thermoanaerobaculia bacterium]|nr:AmmeMemoRadiSam system protein B [Thermoanaerobaculia bacterium]